MISHEVSPYPTDFNHLPIQAVPINIPAVKETTGKREECLMDHKGYPWNLIFRYDRHGFVIPLQ